MNVLFVVFTWQQSDDASGLLDFEIFIDLLTEFLKNYYVDVDD